MYLKIFDKASRYEKSAINQLLIPSPLTLLRLKEKLRV